MRARGVSVVVVALAQLLGAAAFGEARVDQARVGVVESDVVCSLRIHELLDDRTASTVDSGLSGTCTLSLAVVGADDRVVARRSVQWHLARDLWEDRYVVTGGGHTHTFASLAAADSFCATVARLPLVRRDRLRADRSYRLAVAVDVQPLGAEDQDRLSQYVSRRGGEREEVDLDLGAFFGQIFGGGDTGRRRLTWTGPPFTLAQLEAWP